MQLEDKFASAEFGYLDAHFQLGWNEEANIFRWFTVFL